MALFSECMPQCAQKLLDTADIVRDAILHQLTSQGLVIQAHELVHLSCPTKGAGKMRDTTLSRGHGIFFFTGLLRT